MRKVTVDGSEGMGRVLLNFLQKLGGFFMGRLLILGGPFLGPPFMCFKSQKL